MENGIVFFQPGWDENDSKNFIDYGLFFVPERERQHEIICSAIPKTTVSTKIVDICCGDGLLDRVILRRFPHHQLYLFDGSMAMLEKAKENLSEYIDRVVFTRFDLAKDDWRDFPWGVHAIVSSLAIHHLDDEGKKKLFRDLSSNLVSGGALIIADMVKPACEAGKEIAARDWDDAVYKKSMELLGNPDAYEYFKKLNWNMYSDPNPDEEDRPSTLFNQLKWLEEAGLVNIDVFWMKGGHAIFGGYKP